MFNKIETWLRSIIADEFRKILSEVKKEEKEVLTIVEEEVSEPSHWKATPEVVSEDHKLRKVK